MTIGEFQERLASLYLRLNGYFVSGFIVHAPQPAAGEDTRRRIRTQIDILAVRFPYNCEPERGVQPSEYLQIPSGETDILICEVKGGRARLQFNQALWNQCDVVRTVLRWVGAFVEEELKWLVPQVGDALSPKPINSPEDFPNVPAPRNSQIRGVLFAPDRASPARNQTRYVHGQEIVDYMWKCFRPETPRPECATCYDYTAWGPYGDIVKYFKRVPHKPASMQEIYKVLKVE